jgi:lauroyl/myristoyl acyltransferase
LRLLLAALSLFFRCMPRRVAHAAGALLGWIWYYLIPVRRSVARANLRLAFPEKTERERRKNAARLPGAALCTWRAARWSFCVYRG